jgi:hypothetical protein
MHGCGTRSLTLKEGIEGIWGQSAEENIWGQDGRRDIKPEKTVSCRITQTNTRKTQPRKRRTQWGTEGRNTKDRKNRHLITQTLIIIIIIIIITMTYFKSTIWQSAHCSGFLKNMLPEDDPVWSKHVEHKHRKYIYFNDVLNILTNIIVN